MIPRLLIEYNWAERHLFDAKFCPCSQETLTVGISSVQLTSLYKLVYISYFLYWKHFRLTKQATLMRRSTVLSLPLHLVFPDTAKTKH
jgi:hypothetical protein